MLFFHAASLQGGLDLNITLRFFTSNARRVQSILF